MYIDWLGHRPNVRGNIERDVDTMAEILELAHDTEVRFSGIIMKQNCQQL